MKFTTVGSLRLETEADRSVADLDEDEATLSVDAGRRVLAGAAVDPLSIGCLAVGTSDEDQVAPEWAMHVKIALGLRNASVIGLGAAPASGLTLRIRSDAGRSTGRPATATAELVPSKQGSSQTPMRGRAVDAEHVERLVKAEARALAQVPMGAYVSRATWDSTLEARYRLLIGSCAHREAFHHPPFDPCPRCGRATTLRAFEEGTIHTWTTIAKGGGPTEFDEWQALSGEYAVAIVDLAPGVRVAGMLTGAASALRIGQRVRAVFRRLYAQEGAWRYGTKFQPVDDDADR